MNLNLVATPDRYDVVDCPPQLGYLTLTAMTDATSVLITVHPQMLELMSMSRFLLLLGNITKTIKRAGANVEMDLPNRLFTRLIDSILIVGPMTEPSIASTQSFPKFRACHRTWGRM